MPFTLDISGSVMDREPDSENGEFAVAHWQWSDLDPFTQGYVEALFSSGVAPQTMWPSRFQDLAPETLARIIADCEAMVAKGLANTQEQGRAAWEVRQAGITIFPPLTITLGGDGKVYFAE